MKINTISKMRLLYLLAIILLCANKVDANIDSLKQIWTNVAQPDSMRFNALNEYYKKNLFSQPDSIILRTAYHIDLAQQKNSTNERAIALFFKGIAFSVKGDYDKALIEIHKVIDIYSDLNDSIGLARTYGNIGIVYYHQIDYQQALKFYSKSLALCQENKLEATQSEVLVNLGLLHFDINNYDLSMDFYNRALIICKKLETDYTIGTIRVNIGYVNFVQKNYDQALENSQKALEIFQPLKNQYAIASCYFLNAKIYQELNEIDTALFYVEKSLEIHQAIGNDPFILDDKILLANLIFPTDVNKAAKIGEEVLESTGDLQDHKMRRDLYDLLYNCYKKKRNYPKAISMLEKYNTYSDSLSIEQDHISITKKAIQSEYETKIFNKQLENKQIQAQLKLNQFKKTYTLLFLGTGIILFIIFYYRAKRKIHNQQQEALRQKIIHLNELEKTRHQLIQSEKMSSLGQLTAGVAHEINNPVNFISNGIIGLKKTLNVYIEGPKEEVKSELMGDIDDMILAIEEGAKRTNNIVKSLRLFSRQDTEDYSEADVITCLESTLKLLSHKINDGIFIEKYFERESMLIYCFPGQLGQVFMNILLNAFDAINGNGKVKIEVKEQEKNVIVSITDNGPGIPDDKKEKVFEPFYTTKGVRGTGLGLSITFGIIEKHNGSIEVIDNEPKGSKFVIHLPKRDDSLI